MYFCMISKTDDLTIDNDNKECNSIIKHVQKYYFKNIVLSNENIDIRFNRENNKILKTNVFEILFIELDETDLRKTYLNYDILIIYDKTLNHNLIFIRDNVIYTEINEFIINDGLVI